MYATKKDLFIGTSYQLEQYQTKVQGVTPLISPFDVESPPTTQAKKFQEISDVEFNHDVINLMVYEKQYVE